jgi:hypothetical protein
VNYIDELYNLVHEIDAKIAAAEQAVADAHNEHLTRPLPDGLGDITVTGAGDLVALALDAQTARRHTPSSLAQHLVRGIHATEREAVQQRKATIAAAQEKARLI